MSALCRTPNRHAAPIPQPGALDRAENERGTFREASIDRFSVCL